MKKTSMFAMTALSLIIGVTAAQADTSPFNTKSVVRDTSGQVVTAIESGTCVRSNANAGNDACTRDVLVNTSRTVLSDAERVVYFDFNKATLTPQAQTSLQGVANRLRQATDVKSATIVGYADRIGSNQYNIDLSRRRAEAVKEYLVRNGYMDVNVADIRPLGESRPVTNCSTAASRSEQIACLAPDRRVELELTYTKELVSQHNVVVPTHPAHSTR